MPGISVPKICIPFSGVTPEDPAIAIINDGNTAAWYDYTDATTFTLTGSDIIRWNDVLASGHDLKQGNILLRPTLEADGVLFNGSGDFIVTDTFVLGQPVMIYCIVRMETWTDWDYISDGFTVNGGAIIQENVSPKVCLYAGSQSGFAAGLTVGSFGIVRALFNGANSKLIVNAGVPVTGNFGAGTMAGISLGGKSDGNSPAHVTIKEYIARAVDEAAADEAAIYAYLKAKYSL